jgi:outer membrane protein assembly factor BamB
MPEKNTLSEQTPNTSPRSLTSILLLVGGAVLFGVLLALVISIIEVLRMVDTRSIYLGLDGLRRPIALALATIVGLIAITIKVRPRFRTVALGSLGLVALSVAACSLVRIESFYGNMVPRLAWRWTPPKSEAFADYQETKFVSTVSPVEDIAWQPTGHDHPGFLGANRTGVVTGLRLAENWNQKPPRELWRKNVGLGWGGFAVVGQVAVTQEQRGELEAIVCYDLQTGQERWVHGDPIRFIDEHGDGPRATPTIHQGRVYALGATGMLTCVDGKDGNVLWQQQALPDPDKTNLLWGMSGSPLVLDDLVIVSPGGAAGNSLIAYRTDNGQQVWSGGDDPAAYASPSQVELAGTSQCMIFNGSGLRGFSLDGEPLWLFPWITQGERQRVNVAQPQVVTPPGSDPNHGYVLISSGYSMGTALLEIVANVDGWQASPVWQSRDLKSKMSNFVVVGNSMFGLDNGILTCLDLATGKRQWKRGRYGHGQLLAVEDKLLIQTETGEVVLVAADAQGHRELGKLTALDGKTWNHAALAGDLLLVRNDREAACYQLPVEPKQP